MKHQPAGGKRKGDERVRDFMRQKLMNQIKSVIWDLGALSSLCYLKKKPQTAPFLFAVSLEYKMAKVSMPQGNSYL